jgi:anti-sigma regulatory factor (Ser/Thr protein kinase)
MVGTARRFVTQAMAQWDGFHDPAVAVLLTNELVTNAIVHARTEVTLVLRFEEPLITVEVHDESDQAPHLLSPDRSAEHGRGLALVDQLADRWGVRAKDEGGKVVWFDLTPGPKA